MTAATLRKIHVTPLFGGVEIFRAGRHCAGGSIFRFPETASRKDDAGGATRGSKGCR